MDKPAILYCHCQYAQVVPKDVKDAVLRRLCESGVAFDAVADLCEMSARRDPALKQFAAIAALRTLTKTDAAARLRGSKG